MRPSHAHPAPRTGALGQDGTVPDIEVCSLESVPVPDEVVMFKDDCPLERIGVECAEELLIWEDASVPVGLGLYG